MQRKKNFPGGKQYVVEQLRINYGSNFQWFYGTQVVTYNRRQTIEQSQFPWRGAHDGFFLDEDRLLQNGISVTDDARGGNNTSAERLQLTNLIDEQSEVLRLGFEEKMDFELHLDGTQHPEALAGLDHLISVTPAAGVVGGIDRAPNPWWRNHVFPGNTPVNIVDNIETAWRACTRNGGRPDFVLAGSAMVDLLRTASKQDISRYTVLSTSGQAPNLDPTIGPGAGGALDTGLRVHGVQVTWDPIFDDLDAALAPATPWANRMYFLNCNHIRLRPAQGHDMVTRKPPRVYDQYVYYWALTWKGALCTNRSNAHALLHI